MTEKNKCANMLANTDEDEESFCKRNRTQFDDMKASNSPMSSGFGVSGVLASARRDRSSSIAEKPAELFRKDLISAMKLADSEHLEDEDYLLLQDPWRQDWERGVQVPVCPEGLPDLHIQYLKENELLHGTYAFKLPSKKYLHAMKDEEYRSGNHELHECHKMADEMCRYDLDDIDVAWLTTFNEERDAMGEESVPEWRMEQIMEALETRCYNNMQTMIKTVEGLGIEYDEDVVCDVCRSPEGEDGNEMVFCDSCDLCVHQACYGINTIPEGSWLCRTCALGVNPTCIFCPKMGGAMKSTKSGHKWAHVVCALWIPEVNFLNPEKMDAITNVSQIPNSRWQLVCSVCREKTGACVQCSVKTCKVAFHVTCAVQAGYEMNMKNSTEEDYDDGFLKGYCRKHTRREKRGELTPRKHDSPRKSDLLTPKKEYEMTEEEKTEARSAKLEKLAEEFYECVTSEEVAEQLQMENLLVDYMYAYWILKRKANFNRPLITPKIEEGEILSKQQEDSLLARMKMFIHLRQDLERVRNLCYMVSRREKISKHLNTMKEDVFRKQVQVLDQDVNSRIGRRDMLGIVEAHKAGDNIYDQHDHILALADLCEKRDKEESKACENENVTHKARIKLEGRRQNDCVDREKLDCNNTKHTEETASPRKRGRKPKYSETISDIDVLNVTDDNESNLKEVREKVKEEVLETASVSDLPSLSKQSSHHSNLRVKDQNKISPKKMIERVVNKGLRMTRDRHSSGRGGDEVNGVHKFRKSQLIVPRNIKDQVQTAFQISSGKRGKTNGLCSHAQAKIDRYLKQQKENLLSPHKSRSSRESSVCRDLTSSPVLRNIRHTRSRTLLESDLDSDAPDSLYEPVDGEVSIRSSREASPIRLPRRISPKKRGISHLVLEKRLSQRQKKICRMESETESGQEADSESELSFYGDQTRRTSRRLGQKPDLYDEFSSPGAVSLCRRDRLSDSWAGLSGNVPS